MEKWLYDILWDNTIVDNQIYSADKGVLFNRRFEEPIRLKQRHGSQHKKFWNKESVIWNFLNSVNRNVSKALMANTNELLVLMNAKEYEHNTNDDFIEVSGIDSRNFTLQTGNLIGYVKNGDYALKISSRYGDRFLKHIIADADGFIELQDYGGSSKGGYEWLLIYLWKIKLKKAFRLGLPKLYLTHDETLPKVKGNINPVDYFLNKKLGIYNCTYREHSYNSIQAKLILKAFEKINGHEFASDLHSVKNAFATAVGGAKSKLTELNAAPHFSNPFYYDYNDVIDLSKQILKEEFSNFDKKQDANAFLFDISMLFEYYIRKLLKRNAFILESKFEKRKEIARGTLDKKRRKLEPDIVINTEQGLIVLDVKYKYYDFVYGVKREDLFQLHTYIGQYGNSKDVAGCGFVFPISHNKCMQYFEKPEDAYISSTIEIMGKVIPFVVFFQVIPNDSRDDYHQVFSNYGKHLVENIKNLFK